MTMLAAVAQQVAQQSEGATPDTVGEGARNLVDGLLAGLPRFGIALVVFGIGYVVAVLLRRAFRTKFAANRTESYARVFSRLLFLGVILLTTILAAAVAFPSVQPVDLLAGLGIFSVAIGFAFQDILENLLAGILLLIRQPFEIGDQIEVTGYLGTVEEITLRETNLKTFDGQRIVIPNADVYKNAVRVQTAFPSRRTSLLVGVGYDADLEEACSLALRALAGVDGILDDPAPQAYLTEFGASSMTVDLRYWTAAAQADVRRLQHQAVVAVKRAYDAAGIDIPFDIRTLEASPSLIEALRVAGRSDAHGDASGGDGHMQSAAANQVPPVPPASQVPRPADTRS